MSNSLVTSSVREAMRDLGYEELVIFDNPSYDDAIIGISSDDRVIYDYGAMMQCLMERGHMDETEAAEFISYNTIRSLDYYPDDKKPIILMCNIRDYI